MIRGVDPFEPESILLKAQFRPKRGPCIGCIGSGAILARDEVVAVEGGYYPSTQCVFNLHCGVLPAHVSVYQYRLLGDVIHDGHRYRRGDYKGVYDAYEHTVYLEYLDTLDDEKSRDWIVPTYNAHYALRQLVFPHYVNSLLAAPLDKSMERKPYELMLIKAWRLVCRGTARDQRLLAKIMRFHGMYSFSCVIESARLFLMGAHTKNRRALSITHENEYIP